MSKFIAQMNRTQSGFHILGILSLADGNSSHEEMSVITEFLETSFSGRIDLIREQAFLKALPRSEYETHFAEVAAHFYSLSSQEDRNLVVNFAMQVVLADQSVKSEENKFVNLLYDSWDLA